jgi:hypothetical protein
MKRARKWLSSLCLLLFLALQVPLFTWAQGAVNEESQNPFTVLKAKMKFNWRILEGADWLFYLIMIALSAMMIGLLIYTVYGVVVHLIHIRRGKANLKDSKFWIESGVIIFILFLFFSGAFFSLLENVYSWTNTLDLGGDGKHAMAVTQPKIS